MLSSVAACWPRSIWGAGSGVELALAGRRLYLSWGSPAKRVTWEFRAPAGEAVTLRSELGRVRLASGGREGAEVTARADAGGRLRVSAEALGVGEPEVPGDFLEVASTAGTERLAVWIEPALGQWRGAADGGEIELGIAAVHAALVRTSRGAEIVLLSPPRRRRPDGTFVRGQDGFVWDFDAVDRCELARLDPETLNVRPVPFEGSGLERVNLFCSGHVHLGDGRLLFAGGHVSSRPGDPVTAGWLHLFDPRGPGEGWQRVPVPLARERWYPSLVTLPDCRVLIASGSAAPLNGDHRDHLPLAGYYGTVDAGYELFDPGRGLLEPPSSEAMRLVDLSLDRRDGEARPQAVTTYPALFVLPGGSAGVLLVQEAHRGWLHELVSGGTPRLARRCYRMVATRGSRSYPHYGSAVLLPFADGDSRLRLLVVGGQHEREDDHGRLDARRATTDTAEIFDYDAARPLDRQRGWRAVGPALERRALGDATLLADGTVLVSGGISRGWANHNRASDAVLVAEIFDPTTETFRPAARARLDRRYHSTALLLPDGSVLKMGSTGGFGAGRDEARQPWTRPRFDAERYLPGYLWRGPRPRVTRLDADGTLAYGSSFSLEVVLAEPDPPRVLALRLGSVTHGLDMDQRAVWLEILGREVLGDGRERLRIRAPGSGAVAPPGDYQLVVIDGRGVPSRGVMVRFG
ncbi:MAG: galactose oxidase early set domain-containing protein [Thermoanaerobaculia bacterium]|nr:galactose oxidase early set domain-containing protein [Thermoanaerobaculia bacterium]